MKLVGIFLGINIQCCIILAANTNRGEIGIGRIMGGHEAVAHSHPYVVSLQLRIFWVRTHYCGGALISDSWILTAGHCIKGSWILYLLGIDAVAGTHNVNFPGSTAQIIRIVERIPHPKYDGNIGPHDIGLVKTKHPFQFKKEIQPINLPMDSIVYPTLTLVGWGELRTTWFFPALPSKLQEVKLEYLPFAKCYNSIESLLEDDEQNPLAEYAHICTGPITGGISACNGDSGGPLIEFVPILKSVNTTDIQNTLEEEIRDEDDSFEYVPVILGVVSWGVTPCGEVGAPTVFTNVTDNMKFILETTKLKL